MAEFESAIFRDSILKLLESLKALRDVYEVDVIPAMRTLHIPREAFLASRRVYERLDGGDGSMNIRRFLDALRHGLGSEDVVGKASEASIRMPADHVNALIGRMDSYFADYASTARPDARKDQDAFPLMAAFAEYCIQLLFAADFGDREHIRLCPEGAVVTDGSACRRMSSAEGGERFTNPFAWFEENASVPDEVQDAAMEAARDAERDVPDAFAEFGAQFQSQLSDNLSKLGTAVRETESEVVQSMVTCPDGSRAFTHAQCRPTNDSTLLSTAQTFRCPDGTAASSMEQCGVISPSQRQQKPQSFLGDSALLILAAVLVAGMFGYITFRKR